MPPYFCADCGRAVEPDATFCTGCGRPVARGSAAPARRPARSGWKPLVVAAIVSIVLVPVAFVSVAAFRAWSVATEVQAVMDEELPATVHTDPALVDWVEVDETAPPAPAPAPDGVYGTGDVDEVPQLLNRDEVMQALTRQYPPLMRDAGVPGEVQVQFRVLPDGTVDPARMTTLETSHPAFSEAAERVVRRMRFRPGRLAGEAVTTEVVLPITFRITP